MAGLPLVSCVLVTRNRRRFVSQAIGCFLRQTYAPRELIVVDDGDDPVGDLIPEHRTIRYIRTLFPLSIGAKRNQALTAVSGEFVAHWDDDTSYSAQRLEIQVQMLRQSGREVSGLDRLLYYDPTTGSLWKHDVEGCPALLHPGTLLYSRT